MDRSIECIRVCGEVSADHEAPSQAEARRGDDRCERRVSTHGECHYSKLWRDFHPDGKESPQVKDRSPQRKGKKSNSDASSSDAVYNDVKTSHKASRRKVESGDRGEGAKRMQDSTGAGNRARKAPPGTWTGQSNAYASVARCPLTTRHQARLRPGVATTGARDV